MRFTFLHLIIYGNYFVAIQKSNVILQLMNTTIRLSQYIKLRIISFVLFTFLGYFCIGLPLAVLPIYIHKTLGFSEVIAGIVISLQYFSTFIIRGYAGTIVDRKGPKLAVTFSMLGFLISGILLLCTFLLQKNPMLSLIILSISRLIMGVGEGMVGASPINWAMLTLGERHTPNIISYNGIASYGALALGAPLGVLLSQNLGLESIAVVIIIIAIAGGIYAVPKPPVLVKQTAVRFSFLEVLGKVAPLGICLGLAGLGFGGISNFITLYYDYFNWKNAALCLSVFSVTFVMTRFVFSNAISKYGGINVGLICFLVEILGLFFLFQATSSLMALIGAGITGFGFSLVFPALGVEAVKMVPSSNAGAALAAYGLFIDISLGLTGPLAGFVIKFFGMPFLFAFCCLIVVLGGCILLIIKLKKRKK